MASSIASRLFPFLLCLALLSVGCGNEERQRGTGNYDSDSGTGGSGATTNEVPGGSGIEGGEIAPSTIEIVLADNVIMMPTTLKGGVATFKIANKGKETHSLRWEGPSGIQSLPESLEPGESTTMESVLYAGQNKVYCPLDDHEKDGMVVNVTVTE